MWVRGFQHHVLMMRCKWGTYWSLGGHRAKRIFHLNVLPTVTNSQTPGGDPLERSGGPHVCMCGGGILFPPTRKQNSTRQIVCALPRKKARVYTLMSKRTEVALRQNTLAHHCFEIVFRLEHLCNTPDTSARASVSCAKVHWVLPRPLTFF